MSKCNCTAYCGQYLMQGSCPAYQAAVTVAPAPAPLTSVCHMELIAASARMLAELEKVEKLLQAISATDYPVSEELAGVQRAIAAARGSHVPVQGKQS